MHKHTIKYLRPTPPQLGIVFSSLVRVCVFGLGSRGKGPFFFGSFVCLHEIHPGPGAWNC